jgi:hypothetical protein
MPWARATNTFAALVSVRDRLTVNSLAIRNHVDSQPVKSPNYEACADRCFSLSYASLIRAVRRVA